MNIRVKDIMVSNPITVNISQTVFDLREIMLLHQPECVLIQDAKKTLVGIMTPNCLATAATVAPDEPIEKYMIKVFKKISANATIQEAASLLLSQEVEALPVVDGNDRIIGMVNYKDIVKDLVDEFSQKLSPEAAVIYLAMTKDPEQEEYWLQKVINAGFRAAITQVGATAEKLPIKLREATIVAAIARSVIREDPREKFAVSNAVRDIYSQLNIINPGLGGGFKVAIVRGEGRIAVAAFGRCGHALANGYEQIVMGTNIV